MDGDEDAGLNKNTGQLGLFPRAVTFESGLFLTFMEGLDMFAGDPTQPDQIRVIMAPDSL